MNVMKKITQVRLKQTKLH